MAKTKRLVKTISLPNGKRKYIYATTREELEKKYAEARLEMCAGVDISDSTQFGEFAQMWFNTFKKGKLKAQSERNLKSLINNHLMPYLAEVELRKITSMQCSQIVNHMTEKGINSQTQAKVISTLKNIMDCAVDNNIIMRSPVTASVKPGGKKCRSREAISPAAAEKLVEDMRNYPSPEAKFTQFALLTAMRIGEIMALQWSDIDMENRVIHVRATLVPDKASQMYRQEHTKSAAGMRDIPYGDTVASILAQMKLLYNSDYVFTWHGHQHLTYGWAISYRQHLKECNPAVTPHVLRHTAITNWICVHGMDVKTAQYLAGHSDVQITYNIYTSYIKESQFDATARLIQSIG